MLRWTERAANDLVAIGDYIAADDPTAARAWVEKLRRQAMKASRMPRMGRVVPEIARDDVREVFQRSYRIIYRLVDDGIVVLTVFEGHRLLGKLDPDQG
ncbi:MAG: type II toxin-antitoxin system RelE/ParE family toxin [Planctomycetes bacterium]|nr:type II toxin-antitoxin system RelE/ParE family toxin [Planctomycetota bacterium]